MSGFTVAMTRALLVIASSSMASFSRSTQPVQLSRPPATIRDGLPCSRSKSAPRILRSSRNPLLGRVSSSPNFRSRCSILHLDVAQGQAHGVVRRSPACQSPQAAPAPPAAPAAQAARHRRNHRLLRPSCCRGSACICASVARAGAAASGFAGASARACVACQLCTTRGNALSAPREHQPPAVARQGRTASAGSRPRACVRLDQAHQCSLTRRAREYARASHSCVTL